MITSPFYTYRQKHFTTGNASLLWYLSEIMRLTGLAPTCSAWVIIKHKCMATLKELTAGMRIHDGIRQIIVEKIWTLLVRRLLELSTVRQSHFCLLWTTTPDWPLRWSFNQHDDCPLRSRLADGRSNRFLNAWFTIISFRLSRTECRNNR